MKAQEKGKKKKKAESAWTAKRIGLIVLGVGFALIMVVTSWGMAPLASLKPAQAGESVSVGLTFYDGQDRPVLTNNIRLFNATYDKGGLIWLISPQTMRVGINSTKEIVPVPAYRYDARQINYAIFGSEWDTVASALEGMRQGDVKKVTLEQQPYYIQPMSNQTVEILGYNMSTIKEGQQIPVPLMEPSENLSDVNKTPEYFFRTATILNVSPGGVIIDIGSARVDVTAIQLGTS